MTEATVRQRVHELVVEAAPSVVGDLDSSQALVDDLGYDSLSLLELLNLIEAEFDLPAMDRDFSGVKTLRDTEDMVLGALSGLDKLADS